MQDFEIMKLDVMLTENELKHALERISDKMEDQFGEEYDCTFKKTTSNSGKEMVLVNLKELNTSSEFECVANFERSVNKVHFTYVRLRSFGDSFHRFKNYDPSGTLLKAIWLFLEEMSTANNDATSAFIIEGTPHLYLKGRQADHRIKGIGLIDDKGRCYMTNGEEKDGNIGAGIEDEHDFVWTPKYMLNDWLSENPKLKETIQQNSKEVFDIMGKYAIHQKRNDVINVVQFIDLFTQINNLASMSTGFNDPTIKQISELFN